MTTQQLTNNQKTQINNQNGDNSTESDVTLTSKYNVYSSNKGGLQKLTSYGQIKSPHHGGGNYQTTEIDGQTQRTRADGGKLRVVQDLVLQQGDKFNVGVPSGVSGYAVVKRDIKANGRGYGNYVEIQDAPGGEGKVIARYAHLASTKVKTGDTIKRGTVLGIQGDSGAPGAIHLHVEMESKEYARYITDLQSGKFSNKETSSQKTSSNSMNKTTDVTAYKDEINSDHQHNHSVENGAISKATSSQKISSNSTNEAASSQEIGSDSTNEATSPQEINRNSTNEATSSQEISNDSTSSQEIGSDLTNDSTSSQETSSDSTNKSTNTVANDLDIALNNETTTNLPKIYEGNNIQENNTTDVSKVVELLRKNCDEVKHQYGLDVTTFEGLGKAVMLFWKENNLDPKTLKDQLPQVSSSEFATALMQVTSTINNNTNTISKDKQLVS